MHVRVLLSRYRAYGRCLECDGARLKPEALLYRLGQKEGLNVGELYALTISEARDFFLNLELNPEAEAAGSAVLAEIRSRLDYLFQAGVGYLTLDRQSRTLSGGEVQRVNLTTAIGSALVNTLYVLDEPSVGLHPRDNERLMDEPSTELHAGDLTRLLVVLQRLVDRGDTVVIIEHNMDVIASADWILDLGPGGGEQGGQLLYQGPRDGLLNHEISRTAEHLRRFLES